MYNWISRREREREGGKEGNGGKESSEGQREKTLGRGGRELEIDFEIGQASHHHLFLFYFILFLHSGIIVFKRFEQPEHQSVFTYFKDLNNTNFFKSFWAHQNYLKAMR